MKIVRNTEPDQHPAPVPQPPLGVVRFAVLIALIAMAAIVLALFR